MKGSLFLLIIFLSQTISSQLSNDIDATDNRYFEDQFYFGITYNFIRNKPEDFKQRNLSYGLHGGFIKDIPLNNLGTRALGIGVGLSLNNYYSNLVVRQDNADFNYIFDSTIEGFKRTKLETHIIEFPLEYRWRTSTAKDYKFWRVYTGVKAGYVLGARSKLVTNDFEDGFFNGDVKKFQYGLTLNIGYNTFNVHLYYSLTDLFNEGTVINGQAIGFRPLQVGFVFYIL